MFGFNKQKRLNAKLAAAADSGNIRIIAEVLDAGADIEMRGASRWGDTPLGAAAYNGRLPAVKLLLDRGADIEAKDNTGIGPLATAIYKEHADVVVELLKRGANRNAQDDKGLTPLDAAREGNARIRAIFDIKDETPPPASAPASAISADPDEIVLRRKIGDKVLEEVFNFGIRERISLIRAGEEGTVEAMTRENFDAVSPRALRKAFDAYARAGGAVPEAEVFPDAVKLKSPPRQMP